MSKNQIPTVIPRVEHQKSHKEFLYAAEPDAAMMNLIHAHRVVKNGGNANSYFPDKTTVIVTSTIPDNKLDMYSWERERDVIMDFKPDYHIPTDYPVYADMEREERINNIKKLVEGTVWMLNELPDEITILPLVKGYSVAERNMCYSLCKKLGSGAGVYYGTQYFTQSQGPYALFDDLKTINEESNLKLLLIGLLSTYYLPKVPSNVVSVAGQNQWIKAVEPRNTDSINMWAKYNQFVLDIQAALEKRE